MSGGPNLPRFSTFSADLGHFIFILSNFDAYFIFMFYFLFILVRSSQALTDVLLDPNAVAPRAQCSQARHFALLNHGAIETNLIFLATLSSLSSRLLARYVWHVYRNANHRSFNIGATAPHAQNLAVPNHTIINQLIFIMAPSFSLPMICHILHGGCKFFILWCRSQFRRGW